MTALQHALAPEKRKSFSDVNIINIVNVTEEMQEKETLKVEYEEGGDLTKLKKNMHVYYIAYWRDRTKGGKDPVVEKLIAGIDKDVKVRSISDRIAIAERTMFGPGGTSDKEYRGEDIWIFRNNTWMRLTGYVNKNYKVKFMHLNNDEHIDALVQGGCCDTAGYNVFLGDPEKVLAFRQDIAFIGNVTDEIKGKCADARIIVHPYASMARKIRALSFNCDLNGFSEITADITSQIVDLLKKTEKKEN